MSQEYTPVEWVDDSTIINANRLDRMQTAHHYADGFREVDTVPTEDPEVDYHMVVYCTLDSTFYRWDGTQWAKDVDDTTKALLQQEITRAEGAESALGGRITAEATARGQADDSLSGRITSNADAIYVLQSGKVDKVAGKGLSANDYTDTDKAKLAGIASGAEVNVQADWTQADSTKDNFIKNKPTLATVATSGSYNDLSNKPTIPTVPVQDVTVNGTSVLDGTTAKVVVPAIPDLSLVTSGSGSFVTGLSVSGHQITQTLGTPAVATVDWSEIENKPTFAAIATSGSYSDLLNNPFGVTDVSITES